MNAVPIDPSATVDSLVSKGGPPRSSAEGSSRLCGIYGIWCESDEKWYVGQSRDILLRWRKHWTALVGNRHHNPILQHAWNAHGPSNFLWVILLECPRDPKRISAAERDLAGTHQALAPAGFTLIAGEDHKIITETARRQMSERLTGRKLSKRHRQNISRARTGRKVEYKPWSLKKRESWLRRKAAGLSFHTPEARERMRQSSPHSHPPHTEEAKRKISLAKRGKRWTEEQKAAKRGKPWSAARRAAQQSKKENL